MQFQQAASDRINAGLANGDAARPVVEDLNRLFRESFARQAPGTAGPPTGGRI
jgi:multiple sugar transport system substrate-binding protein